MRGNKEEAMLLSSAEVVTGFSWALTLMVTPPHTNTQLIFHIPSPTYMHFAPFLAPQQPPYQLLLYNYKIFFSFFLIFFLNKQREF